MALTWKETETFSGEKHEYAKVGADASITRNKLGQYWLRTIHPYDLTEYHWAYSDGGIDWQIYLTVAPGTRWAKHERRAWFRNTDPARVVEKLREFDRQAGLQAHIDHS
jgi:hypothetical protein